MGTTAEKLQNIANAKSAIASAITTKGGTVPTKFIDYGTAILNIPSPTPVLIQKSITENGTYDASDDNADGYSEVTVNVSGGGGGGPFAALVDRSITTVTAQDLSGVTSIGTYAFYRCSSLTSITIPDNVTSIGSDAFYNCSGLTSVTIQNGVTSIGYEAFYRCSSLTSITIPDSVTSIGDYAFAGCSGLTSVTIPDNVTSIGNYTFYNCNGLESVIIGNGVTSIGTSAFLRASNLATIDFGTTRSTIPTLGNVSAFKELPANYQILVPSALLEDWKAANNWNNSEVVDHIVAHP